MRQEVEETAKALETSDQEKQSLVTKERQLEAKVTALVVSVMQGPQEHREAGMRELQQEVNSLKVVLEIKNKELREVQEQKLALEVQQEDYVKTKEIAKSLMNKVDDLKAQLIIKTRSERSKVVEVERLESSLKKEALEKRRVSLRKEELEWRVRERTPPQAARGRSSVEEGR